MIQNYQKQVQRGKELCDTHSKNYLLSADALQSLVQDCKKESNGWYLALLDEFYIGIAVGYRMALADQKH